MKLGIIGGSGLYDIEGIANLKMVDVETPFGSPSDSILSGKLGNLEVYFLPRHGRGHKLLPAEVNHRANIFALKSLGVDKILSISAVGSLREDFKPRDIVFPDQFYDRTKASDRHTFFGNGIVAHIGFAEPLCNDLRTVVADIAREVASSHPEDNISIHFGGTYVNMEGPAFSTKAESHVYRKLGFDIIGMTCLAEAKLSREAEICYACMSMVTDYDCWLETEEAVSVEMVIKTLMANVDFARETLTSLTESITEQPDCSCNHALENAIMTNPDSIPVKIKQALKPIIGRYIK